jgi:hypothetical protein
MLQQKQQTVQMVHLQRLLKWVILHVLRTAQIGAVAQQQF